MVKCGLNTVFLVFPIGFDLQKENIPIILFKNNVLNIYLFDVNLHWECKPHVLKE